MYIKILILSIMASGYNMLEKFRKYDFEQEINLKT